MIPRLAVAAIASLLFASHSAKADSVDSAYLLCRLVDGAGLASAPCAVSGWNATVTATVDMNSGEARKLCGQMAELMRQKGHQFDSKWTLQIKSPYSGANSIAFCRL